VKRGGLKYKKTRKEKGETENNKEATRNDRQPGSVWMMWNSLTGAAKKGGEYKNNSNY